MSDIEWTEETWNPVRGCKPVSPGCAHCYAEPLTARLEAMGHAGYAGLTKIGAGSKKRLWTGEFREVPEMLSVPLRRRKPTTWFVNSMSDLFGEGVSDGFILDVFRIIAECPIHTFQILTKRPTRMRAWFERWADVDEEGLDPIMARGPAAVRAAHKTQRAHLFAEMIEKWAATHGGSPPDGMAFPTYDWMAGMRWWPTVFRNAWLGVSIEDRAHGLPRIDELRKVPAAIRFLSVEPLLEDLGTIDLTDIHWVIVGGESGPGARPFDLAWARSIVAQCRAANVPCFVKQLGAKPVENLTVTGNFRTHKGRRQLEMRVDPVRLVDRKGGDMSEWPEDLRIREYPRAYRAGAR